MSIAGCDPCKNVDSDERLEGSVSTCRFLSLAGESGESFSSRQKKKEPWSGLLNLAQVPLEWQV